MTNKCRECGKAHETDNEYFCPECKKRCDKREEFRELINQLKEIADLPYPDHRYMSGFSYAEMERFSLTFMKLQHKYNFPTEIKDFVNERAAKEAKKILKVY